MIVKCAEPQASSRRLSQFGKSRITCLVLFVISIILLAGWIIKDRQIKALQSAAQRGEEVNVGKPTLCETSLVNAAVDEPTKDTYFRDDISLGIEEQMLEGCLVEMAGVVYA